jgi:hypothetical protein
LHSASDKIPEISNLKEERFFWAHSFRGFCPWLLGPVALDLWGGSTSWWEHIEVKTALLMVAGKQRER